MNHETWARKGNNETDTRTSHSMTDSDYDSQQELEIRNKTMVHHYNDDRQNVLQSKNKNNHDNDILYDNYDDDNDDDLTSLGGIKSEAETTLALLDVTDKRYKIVSDLCFFMGGSCFLITASWDTTNAAAISRQTDEYPFWMIILYISGPLMYVLNSNVDIFWALHNLQRHGGRDTMRGRQSSWDLFKNLLFGIAAVLELAFVLLDWVQGKEVDDVGYKITAYLYLSSALVAVSSIKKSCSSCERILTSTGDGFFMIGSIMEAILAHMDEEKTRDFYVISSQLWLMNAILYLIADFALSSWCTGPNGKVTEGENNPDFALDLVLEVHHPME